MDMMERKKKIMIAQDQFLPPDYNKLDWLGNSGTQYILTDYIPSSLNAKVEWGYALTHNPANTVMFGLATGSTNDDYSYYAEIYGTYGWYNGCGTSYYGKVHYSPLRGSELNTFYSASMDINSFDLEGYSASPTRYKTVQCPQLKMSIYAYNFNGTIKYFNEGIRFYYIRFYEDGKLVANYVPCLRKSDNKPGMYDTVSQAFYTNSGTGEFLIPS